MPSRTTHDAKMRASEGNNLLTEERRRAILELLQRERRVLVADLAQQFHTSQVTIRKDLDELHLRNLIQRTHGGALPLHDGALEDPSLHEKERGVFECAIVQRQSASVCALDQVAQMKLVQVFPDGNLRGVKLLCEIGYQHSPFPLQQFENRATTFLSEQVVPFASSHLGVVRCPTRHKDDSLYRRFSTSATSEIWIFPAQCSHHGVGRFPCRAGLGADQRGLAVGFVANQG